MDESRTFYISHLHALKRLHSNEIQFARVEGDDTSVMCAFAVSEKNSVDQDTFNTNIKWIKLTVTDDALNSRIVSCSEQQTIAVDTTATSICCSDIALHPNGRMIFFLCSMGDAPTNVVYCATLSPDANTATTAKPWLKLPTQIRNLRVSPQGNYLLFTADVFSDMYYSSVAYQGRGNLLEFTAQRDNEIASGCFIFDQLPLGEADPAKSARLFAQPIASLQNAGADSEWVAQGDPIDILGNLRIECLSSELRGKDLFAVSSDDVEVAVVCRPKDTGSAAREYAWHPFSQIYTRDLTDRNSRARCLDEMPKTRLRCPCYSPEGSLVACLMVDRPRVPTSAWKPIIVSRSTRRVISTSHINLDRSISEMSWSGDEQHLLVTADDAGHRKLFRLSIDKDGYVETLVPEGCVRNPQLIHPRMSNLVVFALDTFTQPPEIVALDIFDKNNGANSKTRKQLSSLNIDLMSKLDLEIPESWELPSGGKVRSTVQGWLFKPFTWDPMSQSRMIAILPEGQATSLVNSWSWNINPQLICSRGFGCLLLNVHGSTGFGQAFADAVLEDFGDLVNTDVRRVFSSDVDEPVLPDWVDPKRIALLGGYTANFLNCQNDDKFFKTFVVQNGIFDLLFAGYVAPTIAFSESLAGGIAHALPAKFEKFNPRNEASDMNTPALIVCTGNGMHLSQSIAAFTCLQRRGIASRLLRLPQNDLSKSSKAAKLWLDTVTDWLDKHLPYS